MVCHSWLRCLSQHHLQTRSWLLPQVGHSNFTSSICPWLTKPNCRSSLSSESASNACLLSAGYPESASIQFNSGDLGGSCLDWPLSCLHTSLAEQPIARIRRLTRHRMCHCLTTRRHRLRRGLTPTTSPDVSQSARLMQSQRVRSSRNCPKSGS